MPLHILTFNLIPKHKDRDCVFFTPLSSGSTYTQEDEFVKKNDM